MGSRIAPLLSNAGHEVIQHDTDEDALEKAANTCCDKVSRIEEAGIRKRKRICTNISYTNSLEALGASDFVIEAITEDLSAKRKLMDELEGILSDGCVIATNSSSFTASEVAEKMDHPEREILFHFSNPPILRDFVEIAKGEETTDETFQFAKDMAKEIEKTAIALEEECRGCVLNRLIFAGFSAAAWELMEGANPEELDQAYLNLGSPTGIFESMDMIGLDVLHSVHRSFVEVYGERFEVPEGFERKWKEMISEGKLGKKSGQGFYEWEGEESIIPDASSGHDLTGIAGCAVNEAYRILDEGIAGRKTIGRAYSLGTGLPTGIFEAAEMISYGTMKEKLDELYEKRENELFKSTDSFSEEVGQ